MVRLAVMAVLCGLICASVQAAPVELSSHFKKSRDERRPVTVIIKFPQGVTLQGVVEATDKGNGTLTLGGLALRLQDVHDDGMVYANDGVLQLDAINVGSPALVVSGLALRTGEKENDPLVPQAVSAIYVLDCGKGRLTTAFSNAPGSLAVGGATARVQCIHEPSRRDR